MTDQSTQKISSSPFSLPRWAAEDYKGDEQDFTNWLVDVIKLTLFGEEKLKEYENDVAAMARMDAEAKHHAMSRTRAIKSKAERAFLYQLYNANETGWFRYLNAEMDTIEELLASIVDATEEGTAEAYDMAFLAKTAIPLLKSAGIDPDDVIGIPFMTAKAAKIVPALRDIMRCPVCGVRTDHSGTVCHNGHELSLNKEQKEAALELTRMVADKNVSTRDIQNKTREMRGKATGTPAPIDEADLYLLDGKDMLVIQSPSPGHTRAIEIALKNIIVDGFKPRDVRAFAIEVVKKVSGLELRSEAFSDAPW